MASSQKPPRKITSYSHLLTFSGMAVALLGGIFACQQFGSLLGGITLILIGAFLALLGRFFFAVDADDSGLTWRTFRGRRHASWEEITDFYSFAPETSVSRTEQISGWEVSLRGGECLEVGSYRTQAESLRTLILEKGTGASAATFADGIRAWQIKGTRPADLPRTFSYTTTSLRSERRFAYVLLGAMIAGAIGMFRYLFSMVADAWNIGFILPIFAILAVFSLAAVGMTGFWGWLWCRGAKARRQTGVRQKRDERFEVRPDGLTFFAEGESRSVAWDAIVGYDFGGRAGSSLLCLAAAPDCCIRTADNRTFTFTNRLTDFPTFQAALRRYASEAVETQLTFNERDALGGIAARWTGGEEGVGDRIYHKRTRSNRLWLRLFWLYSTFGMVQIAEWVLHPPTELAGYFTFGLFLAIFCPPMAVFCTLDYWKDWVLIGKGGVTSQKWGKPRTISWDSIHRLEKEGGKLRLIGANSDVLLTIYPSTYAYGNEIQMRIEEEMRPFQRRTAQGDVADAQPVVTAPASPSPVETPVVLVRRIE